MNLSSLITAPRIVDENLILRDEGRIDFVYLLLAPFKAYICKQGRGGIIVIIVMIIMAMINRYEYNVI